MASAFGYRSAGILEDQASEAVVGSRPVTCIEVVSASVFDLRAAVENHQHGNR